MLSLFSVGNLNCRASWRRAGLAGRVLSGKSFSCAMLLLPLCPPASIPEDSKPTAFGEIHMFSPATGAVKGSSGISKYKYLSVSSVARLFLVNGWLPSHL